MCGNFVHKYFLMLIPHISPSKTTFHNTNTRAGASFVHNGAFTAILNLSLWIFAMSILVCVYVTHNTLSVGIRVTIHSLVSCLQVVLVLNKYKFSRCLMRVCACIICCTKATHARNAHSPIPIRECSCIVTACVIFFCVCLKMSL